MYYKCPLCDSELDYIERYPNYICSKCVLLAVDIKGNRVSFFNEDFSGGIKGVYSDTGEIYTGNECYIKNIKCKAEEARFGGVIIQPLFFI